MNPTYCAICGRIHEGGIPLPMLGQQCTFHFPQVLEFAYSTRFSRKTAKKMEEASISGSSNADNAS